MSVAGLSADPRYLIDNTLDRRSGYQAMQQLLACSPRPTAVVVDNHLSGVGAVRTLLDAGIEIAKKSPSSSGAMWPIRWPAPTSPPSTSPTRTQSWRAHGLHADVAGRWHARQRAA
jgi:hypothetical protein